MRKEKSYRRKNEDEGVGCGRILEHQPQLCSLGFNEPLPQVPGHVVLHGICESVRSDALKDQELLEVIQVCLPMAW